MLMKKWYAVPLTFGIVLTCALLWGVVAPKAQTQSSGYLVSPSPYTDQPGGTISGSVVRELWAGAESYQYRIWCTNGQLTVVDKNNKDIETILAGNSIDVEGAGLQIRGGGANAQGVYIRITN
jgi:hypothetical protein